MDRLEAMSILLSAVEAGSFSGAGRALRMPLATVSRKVAELERHLGTRLLVRTTRRLALTESGIGYVAACRRILDQVGEAEAEVAGEYRTPRGELIITAPVVFGRLHVLPLVNAFLSDFPEIDIRLVLADHNVSLVDDPIDLAVRIGPLPDSSLVASRLGDVRRVVVGSPTYLAAHGTPQAPDDLAALTCITFAGPASGAGWTFRLPNRSLVRAVPPRSRLTVNTAEAAIDAALAGLGLTQVLSYQVAQVVTDGRLITLLRAFEPDPLPVHLVHAARDLLPLKMRRFLDFAAPRLRRSLAPRHDRP